jgi:hypothetical protein
MHFWNTDFEWKLPKILQKCLLLFKDFYTLNRSSEKTENDCIVLYAWKYPSNEILV